MNQVVINRVTPIGTAVAEMLYMMFHTGEPLRGATTITQHSEQNMRITRFKMCLNEQSGHSKHYGCRNAWVCETDDAQFRLYLTDYEDTIELFKTHESFEQGLERVAHYSYSLPELYQACVDIASFLRDETLPVRSAGFAEQPRFRARIAA